MQCTDGVYAVLRAQSFECNAAARNGGRRPAPRGRTTPRAFADGAVIPPVARCVAFRPQFAQAPRTPLDT